MSKLATSKLKTTPPCEALPAAEEQRLAQLLGIFLGLLVVTFFYYPPLAFPVQSLVLGLLLLAGGVGLALRLLLAGGASRAALLSALGQLPLLAGQGLALWALVRWRLMPVTAPGREWVVSLQWLGVALLAGAGVGALGWTQRQSDGALITLRRILVLAAIGFGLHAIYQYQIGYPAALAEMRAGLTGPVRDLSTQSLLHAFEERRVSGRLGNPNLFAAQLSLLGLFCLATLRHGEPRTWRWLAALGYAASLGATLMTGSRGGMLTFIVATGLGAVTLMGQWHRRRVSLPTAAALIFTLLWTAGLMTSRAWAASEGWLAHLGNIATIRERLFYWEIAMKVWARHFWIGEGPGGFSLLYLTLKSPLARESQYAHSWFFQIGAELGLVGLALALLFWGGLAVRWAVGPWPRRACAVGNAGSEARWLLLAALVLALNGLFEFTLQWRSFLIFAGLLAGLGVTADRAASQDSLAGAYKVRGYLSLGMALVIALAALIQTPRLELAELYRWRADDAAQAGDWADAAENYAQAAGLLPDSASLRVAQAGALGQTGAVGAAWPLLVKAARLDPYSAGTHSAMAHWLSGQGRMAEAQREMGEAIRRYPSCVQHRLDRAELLLQSGDAAGARADLLQIEKEHLPVWEYQVGPLDKLRRAAGLAPLPAAAPAGTGVQAIKNQ